MTLASRGGAESEIDATPAQADLVQLYDATTKLPKLSTVNNVTKAPSGTPGTVEASEVVVVDASKNIADFGSVGVASLVGAGDANTTISFATADAQIFTAGGVELLRLVEDTQDAVTFNNGATDVDFTVKKLTSGNVVAYDAGADTLTIGATSNTIAGGVVFADGATDVDVASHDGTNGLKLGGTLVTATAAELNIMDNATVTAAELNLAADLSVNTETIAEGGVVSVTKRITKIVSTGAGAVTLAAPDATMLGFVKVIEMTGGEHDVTLALTNVQGQSSGTTATFSDINDTLVLVAGANKWTVLGEAGIVLS